jgi:hypothetical protein
LDALRRQFGVFTERDFPAEFAGLEVNTIERAPGRFATGITLVIEEFGIAVVRVARASLTHGSGRELRAVAQKDEVEQRLFVGVRYVMESVPNMLATPPPWQTNWGRLSIAPRMSKRGGLFLNIVRDMVLRQHESSVHKPHGLTESIGFQSAAPNIRLASIVSFSYHLKCLAQNLTPFVVDRRFPFTGCQPNSGRISVTLPPGKHGASSVGITIESDVPGRFTALLLQCFENPL